MTLSTVSLSVGSAELPLRVALPVRPGPLLAVVPSIFGVGPDVVGFAERFAAMGALVAVFHPFWRRSSEPSDVDRDARQALARKREHREADTLSDLEAVLNWGRIHPRSNGRTLALGICFGGRFAIQAAARGWVDAAASWHGGGIGGLCASAPEIRVPVAMDFGGADPLIPLEEVDRIRVAFQHHPRVTVAVHPGAGHGFSHVGTRAAEPAAAEAAALRVEGLLQELMDVAP